MKQKFMVGITERDKEIQRLRKLAGLSSKGGSSNGDGELPQGGGSSSSSSSSSSANVSSSFIFGGSKEVVKNPFGANMSVNPFGAKLDKLNLSGEGEQQQLQLPQTEDKLQDQTARKGSAGGTRGGGLLRSAPGFHTARQGSTSRGVGIVSTAQ